MERCDICQEIGYADCKYCSLGNPCYKCEDYDIDKGECTSNGACGKESSSR